jgi:hypothetical protein
MKKDKFFKGVARDYCHNYPYSYPKDNKEALKVRLPFDFIFTRKGEWFYISSCDDWRKFTNKNFALHEPVEEKGEKWKVVNAITGEIKAQSK